MNNPLIPINAPVQIGQGFHSGARAHSLSTHKYYPEVKIDDSYALDFSVPEGTNIYAAQSGIVLAVKDDSSDNSFPTYAKKNAPVLKEHDTANYIAILHDDERATFALYAHLMHGGAIVEEGEHIRQGQIIGYSGDTGFSSAPHLHFVVYEKRNGILVSQPLTFANYRGELEDRALHPELY